MCHCITVSTMDALQTFSHFLHIFTFLDELFLYSWFYECKRKEKAKVSSFIKSGPKIWGIHCKIVVIHCKGNQLVKNCQRNQISQICMTNKKRIWCNFFKWQRSTELYSCSCIIRSVYVLLSSFTLVLQLQPNWWGCEIRKDDEDAFSH